MRRLSTAFLDLIMNLVIVFVYLWFIAFITPEMSKETPENPEIHAEYVFDASWESENNFDVDSWLTRTGHEICGFTQENIGHLMLDMDWKQNDSNKVDGEVPKIARERMTINGKVSGKYQFSLHAYRVHLQKFKVHVLISRNKPYKIVLDKYFEIDPYQELPIIEFELDKNGKIVKKITDPDVLMPFLHKHSIPGIISNQPSGSEDY